MVYWHFKIIAFAGYCNCTKPILDKVPILAPYRTVPYHTIPYHTLPYHTIPYHSELPISY